MSPENTRGFPTDSSEYFDLSSGKFPDDSAYISDSDYMTYSLNLGADSPLDTPFASACPTPKVTGTPPSLRPALRLRVNELSPFSPPTLSACPSLSATSASTSAWSPRTPFSEDEDFPAHTLHSFSAHLSAQSDLHPDGRDPPQLQYSQLDVQPDDLGAKESEALSISRSSILGTRNVLLALVRAAGCVLVVAVLASRGRWGGGSWVADSERAR
ncbi:hypothetical protein C8R44DRAFT_753671 [Mycena epipterygia]|nr:hypothetical protein C8R44DRAFT_753671 [Mycena epipterygia]